LVSLAVFDPLGLGVLMTGFLVGDGVTGALVGDGVTGAIVEEL
jgi:hypothetical protein